MKTYNSQQFKEKQQIDPDVLYRRVRERAEREKAKNDEIDRKNEEKRQFERNLEHEKEMEAVKTENRVNLHIKA